jgi:uncharacterized protein (TIGR03382 family)
MRTALLALFPCCLAAAPGVAFGNSAAPLTYDVEVSGATVTVCADPYAMTPPGRPCPDEGLLRRHVATGEVVVITTCADDGCFVDECVPPGEYQYGLAEPFACSEHSSGTFYYVTASTTEPVGSCARTQGPPAAFNGALPWSGGDTICGDRGPDGGGCSSTGGTLAFDAALLVAGAILWARRRRCRAA